MVLLQSGDLSYGALLPSFSLQNTADGKYFTDLDLVQDIVCIGVICNHCPYVLAMIHDFVEIAKKYEDSVQTLAVSANDPEKYPEDGPNKMKIFAERHDFNFPYLFDVEQDLVTKIDATCTPDLYIYKKINDSYKQVFRGNIKQLSYVYKQLENQDSLSGEQLKPSEGCSIKWRNC